MVMDKKLLWGRMVQEGLWKKRLVRNSVSIVERGEVILIYINFVESVNVCDVKNLSRLKEMGIIYVSIV